MGRAHDDETRQRRLAEALQESEQRFERLVESAKDYAIFMTDADGRVMTWNEGAQRLFGFGETEILGEDASVLFTPEDRESGAPEREQRKARTEAQAHRLTHKADEAEGAPNLTAMIDSLRRAAQGLREAVHELREGEVAGRALARAVEDLVEFERRRSPAMEVELVVEEGVPEELPEEVCKGVLLVVREALVNARRHSSARRVRIALGSTEEEIVMEVSDDGVGFDPRQSTQSVGLGAMRERAVLLSGRLEIFSEPAEGTTVRLRVPRPS